MHTLPSPRCTPARYLLASLAQICAVVKTKKIVLVVSCILAHMLLHMQCFFIYISLFSPFCPWHVTHTQTKIVFLCVSVIYLRYLLLLLHLAQHALAQVFIAPCFSSVPQPLLRSPNFRSSQLLTPPVVLRFSCGFHISPFGFVFPRKKKKTISAHRAAVRTRRASTS